jgi:hypothetical protein
MIYAFNFTCDRDNDLSNLMVQTLYRHCDDLKELVVINTDHNLDYRGYGNGAGWPQSMLKLKRLREFNPADDDFILSVDSDVVFGSREVFIQLDKQYGIIGTKHIPEFNTALGKWSHMSGALIFIRGDIAKKMAALDETTLNMIRFQHFKPFRLTENEDVVLSYLASYCGANQFSLPSFLSSGNFESEVKEKKLRSFYHLNYCPTQFLGEEVAGKWDIPKILKSKGIEL